MNDQGPVVSLKEFAARRANLEDRQRLSKEVTEILRVDKLDELQRRMREVVSGKVQSALQRLKEEMAPADMDALLDPEALEAAQQEAATRKRPVERVEFASTAKEQKAAKEQQLLKQKTLGMEMRQRARLAKTEASQKSAMERLDKQHEAEFAALIKEQAEEMQEFTEACTRMLAVGARWAPDMANAKQWVTQLKNHRYHSSKVLTDMQRELSKYEEAGNADSSKSLELTRKIESESFRELQEWRERLLSTALGDGSSSIISQLAASHKLAQAKLLDRHAQKTRTQEKESAAGMRLLQRHFRSEKEQLIANVKLIASEQSEKQAAAPQGGARWNMLRRSRLNANEGQPGSGKPGAVPQRSDGSVWIAPTRHGSLVSYEESRQQEMAGDERPDSVGTLLRLLWMNPAFDVLRAVLRHPKGMTLFREFVQPQSKRDMIGLTLWQQVQTCLRIADPKEREREAIALHDAHCSVGAGADMQHTSASDLLGELDRRAERVLIKLQEAWVAPFLEKYGTELIKLVQELDNDADTVSSAFATLERLKGTWLEMLNQATERIPYAIITADMYEPGAKLVSVNDAFGRLTGQKRADVLGQNCRFLQGEGTEQDAVRQLVEGLRAAQPVQLELTNYRADGSSFRNRLSLQPVHDSTGVYRYCIGVLADASTLSARDREGYERLCRLLPRSFDAALQPFDFEPLDPADTEDISEDVDSLNLRKVLWLRKPERSLRALLQEDLAVQAFQQYLESRASDGTDPGSSDGEATHQLELILSVREMSTLPFEEQVEAAEKIHEVYQKKTTPTVTRRASEGTADDRSMLIFEVRKQADVLLLSLAQEHLPGFLRSPLSDETVVSVQLASGNRKTSRANVLDRVWCGYKPSPDVVGWLTSIMDAAEMMPIPISISDMRVAGNPLVYVNEAFCRCTGYSKAEAHGRNCRFLQGPETEVPAVAAVVEALRRGTDCTVKMTNYRRSGETFGNLLSIRPVHDSNGVYRFCVAVQANLEGGRSERELLKALMQLLPRHLKLARQTLPCGPYHEREAANADALIDEMVANALEPPGEVVGALDLKGTIRFAHHHIMMKASSVPVPDKLPLSALLWLAPAHARDLEAAFAHETIAPLLESRVSDLENFFSKGELRLFSLRLPGIGHPKRAAALATVLVRNISSFMEAEGNRFLQACEVGGLGQGMLPALPENAQWLEMLNQATERIPYAIITADMYEPGAKLVSVNDAFGRLTGQKRADVLGQNCRFLQGEGTEQDAVRQLVEGLRAAQPVQLELTNYRADGSSFRNRLSLQPVHDSTGVYRYCIGVLADASTLSARDREGYERLCRLLPRSFDAALQPLPWNEVAPALPADGKTGRPTHATKKARHAEHMKRSMALSRLVWLYDTSASVLALVSHAQSVTAFRNYLTRRSEAACEQLSFVVQMREALSMEREEQKGAIARIAAVQLAGRGSDGEEQSIETLEIELQSHMEEGIKSLADTYLPGFMLSEQSDDVVSRVTLGSERPFASSSHLVWDGYNVSPDAAQWLYAVVDAVENLPIPISISDMRVAGNPLVYVNEAFCRCTGYGKAEAHGRNCRFLQGPETEVPAVAAVVEAIRRGTDCTVKMTNYRRSGETFDNLLTLLPVVDSNGVYRFCIGVQCEWSGRQANAALVSSFVTLLPVTIDIEGTPPRGPVHEPRPDSSRRGSTHYHAHFHAAIANAVAGHWVGNIPKASDLRGVVRFSRCHTMANQQLGVFDPSRPFTRLAWLAEQNAVFETLLGLDYFRELFSEHMADSDTPEATAMAWRSLASVSDMASVSDASQSGRHLSEPMQRAKKNFSALLGARRRSLPQIRQDFAKLKASALPQLVAEGCFAGFLQSPRCLRLLEQLQARGMPASETLPRVMPGTWVEMLANASAGLPFGIIAAQMNEPGAKLICVNPAFESLTRYAASNAVGRNCRFLQGEKTEAKAVHELVEGLRAAQPVQVELTNYRADGSSFRNLLSLQPVHDSDGVYRYCIGVLADASELSASDRRTYERLCRLLPRLCEDDGLEEDAATNYVIEPVSPETRCAVAELVFLNDLAFTLSSLARDESLIQRLGRFLGPRQIVLDFWNEASEVDTIFDEQQRNERAVEVINKYLDPRDRAVESMGALAYVSNESEVAFNLLTEVIPELLADPVERTTVIEALLRQDYRIAQAIDKAPHHARALLWNRFRLKSDVGGWLLAFVAAAEQLPIAISVSDIARAGNPLIFSNTTFSEMTGMPRSEIYGRNCRFLQGPETSEASVASLKQQMRRGADCFTRMTNFRKSSEPFENLLCLRTVRDATGKARFSVSFSLPLNEHVNQQEHLHRISRFLARLPRTIGDVEPPQENAATSAAAILNRMQELLSLEPREAHAGAVPLFAHDPPIERMRYITELTRLHWSTLSPVQMTEMLIHDATRDTVVAYVHARSAGAAQSLRQFITRQQQQLKAKASADDGDGGGGSDASDELDVSTLESDITLSKEDLGYLDDVRRRFFVPFVMTEEQLGGLVATTANASFALDEDATWVGMLGQTTQNLPYALIASDMYEPGAKLVTVNGAFEQLTGWASADAIGKNCRFLQGFQTEQRAVKQIVDAVRMAQPIQIELTNYKADSSTFRNLLSLQPVFDADGVYRYCIGVLADASAMTASEREGLERLRSHLPRRCAALPTKPHAASNRVTTGWALPEASLLPFAKIRMLCDPENSLLSTLEDPHHLELFRMHIKTAAPEKATTTLEFYVEANRFLSFSLTEQREKVHTIFSKYGGEFEDKAGDIGEYASKQVALGGVKVRRDASLAELAIHLPSFVCSARSDELAPRWNQGLSPAMHLVWDGYNVSPDAAPWLYAVVDAVENLPIPISISDMRVAGNPLVYVNEAFCRCTGYSKAEAHGRNCRFLQGPETEVPAVAAVVEALRRGTDCTVKMTNYRRSGETFGNLLSIRPVHDSNGVYRFCVAVQADASLSAAEIELYSSLVILLPVKELGAQPSLAPKSANQSDNAPATGTEARLRERSSSIAKRGLSTVPIEQRTRYVRKEVEKALGGRIPVERAEDLKDAVRFHDHYKQVIKDIEGLEIEEDESTSLEEAAPSEMVADIAAIEKPAAPGTSDAALVFTKMMWFRSRSPEYVQHLLSLEIVGRAWLVSMRSRQVLTSGLAFCFAVAQLDSLSADERHAELYCISERFLGTRHTLSDATAIEAQVRQEEVRILADLVKQEFADFLTSWACDALILQLRQMPREHLESKQLFLEPPAVPLPVTYATRTESIAELVRVIGLAIYDCSVAIMVCDRTVPGLPITCVSAGVPWLTGYDPADLIGRNCRLLQGPETQGEAVAQITRALVEEKMCEVKMTNYRKDGTSFVNQLTISPPLRVIPGTELVTAVLRRPPHPLTAARSDAETEQLVRILSSCNTGSTSPCTSEMASEMSPVGPWRTPVLSKPPLNFETFSPELLTQSRERLLDAETVLHNVLRLPTIRAVFLAFALSSGAPVEVAGDASGSNLPPHIEQDVQLIMHSENVLADRHHYLRMACSLWAEMDALNKTGRGASATVAMVKKHVQPERGTRRYGHLWRALRTTIYDPLDSGEHSLEEEGTHWTAASNVAILLSAIQSADGHWKHPRAKSSAGHGSPVGNRPSKADKGEEVEPPPASNPLEQVSSDDLLGPTPGKDAPPEGRAKELVIIERRLSTLPTLPPMGGAFDGNDPELEKIGSNSVSRRSSFASARTSSPTASEASNADAAAVELNKDEGSDQAGIRDLCMLQHILLRVMAIEVLPSFLASADAQLEVQRELQAQSTRKALHDVLQLELSSAAASTPTNAEEWAATFSAAMQFVPHPVLLCDMSLPGVPIVSVNSAFEILTGYDAAECVGSSCRFLQGKRTDPKALKAIGDAIRGQTGCHVTLQNYKRDGTPFLNLLSLKPIFDADGLCCYMLGCPVEVSEHYSGTKTQLRHVDRLLKLTASKLTVRSTPKARQRMEQIQATVLREQQINAALLRERQNAAAAAREAESGAMIDASSRSEASEHPSFLERGRGGGGGAKVISPKSDLANAVNAKRPERPRTATMTRRAAKPINGQGQLMSPGSNLPSPPPIGTGSPKAGSPSTASPRAARLKPTSITPSGGGPPSSPLRVPERAAVERTAGAVVAQGSLTAQGSPMRRTQLTETEISLKAQHVESSTSSCRDGQDHRPVSAALKSPPAPVAAAPPQGTPTADASSMYVGSATLPSPQPPASPQTQQVPQVVPAPTGEIRSLLPGFLFG